ncbi:MAG TPA: DUF3306 domain-containing protein [Methylophaga sp.]|nr:DUF3306 domain-containing protein [Methylophaga sp.]
MPSNDSGFLSRWSSRKLQKTEQQTEKPDDSLVEPIPTEAPVEQANANLQEAGTSERPSWQDPELDQTSRRQALREIFRKPGIGIPDGLDEYERDYNYHNFAKLGDVVTHEMRRLLEKQAEQLAASAEVSPDKKSTIKPETSESEDNKLA